MTNADTTKPIPLNRDTLQDIARSLPPFFKQVLKFILSLENGSLIITFPDGLTVRADGRGHGPTGVIRLIRYRAVMSFLRRGDIGFAEAYIAGDWESDNLVDLLELFFRNLPALRKSGDRLFVAKIVDRVRHYLRRNTRGQARKNIQDHYDLGNSFYGKWLDPSMTYSCGDFSAGATSLQAAQEEKYHQIATRLDLRPEHSVLDIGCGWGGFAEFAAQEIGCSITGLTISPAQFDYARERIFNAGLNEKVTLHLRDYRDENGAYDRIASIEMIEAVGAAYWPSYYQQLHDRLRPGARAAIQAITIRDEDFDYYRKWPDFIQTYIFPGGMLLSPGSLRQQGEHAGFSVSSERAFGASYAMTLNLWRKRFNGAWAEIQPLGFDERFRRLWNYYLSYCEAGFLSGRIDVRQVIYTRNA